MKNQTEPTPLADDIALVKREFPDFDGEVLNLIPLKCEAWHNDAMPVYRKRFGDTCYIELWTNYADPAQRELGGKRFIASAVSEEHGVLLTAQAETLDDMRQQLEALHKQTFGYVPSANRSLGSLISAVFRVPIEYARRRGD